MQPDSSPVAPESTTSTPVDQSAHGQNDSRWTKIKGLFESALSLDESELQTFLDVQCGTDEELRRDLESLLAAHDDTGDFLESPLGSVKSMPDLDAVEIEGTGPDAAKQDVDPRIGSRLGAYRLEREVGRGGMGTVYLATRADREFDKRVAIKLIRRDAQNEFAIRRFRHERQILARIEHPYVARLIDGGTSESGLPYFVMEFVEGQPIKEYCEAQPLNTRERLELFLKVCSAVQYAHERGIVHRDLKPSNVLVKTDGTPKLLDFGIAKLIGSDSGHQNEATVAGLRILTPAYASPEQMRGDAATVRSDVYSLGVILYELLCGERPSLSTFQPNAFESDRPQEAHLSTHLRAIVFEAIRWDPDERYPSVESFGADLQRYLEGVPPKANTRGVFEGTAGGQTSIAILPFRTPETADSTYGFLSSGITEALITRLSRIERFSVRPSSAVLKYAQRSDTARVAKDLRVRYVLEGSVHPGTGVVRVNVQLVFAEAGVAVWAASFDEPARDLLRLEDSIAEQVAYALIPQLSSEEREKLSKSGTESGLAHEAYLRGRWHWNRSAANPDELAKALVSFMQAISEDPKYARAHAGVADYYLRLGLWGGLPPAESFAAAIKSAETALQLDPTLGEAHASLAFALWAYHRDYWAAEEHFNLAIIRSPEYASAHHWFGLLNSARNRPELAIANLERARKVDPNSPVIAAALGFVYYNARNYAKALELLLHASQDLRNSSVILEMLTWCYLKSSENTKALETARRSVELSDRGAASLAALAHAEVANGNPAGATAARQEIETIATARYVSGYDRAAAAMAVGDTASALKHLEQAAADHDWWVCWVGVDPRWDALRKDHQFKILAARIQPATESEQAVSVRPSKRLIWAFSAALLLLCLVAGVFAVMRLRRPALGFSNSRFTRLTTKGNADSAVISPNGQFIAYTTLEGGEMGLWLRDLKSSASKELMLRIPDTVTGLSFTQNGNALSYLRYSTKQPFNRQLYVLPVNGGSPQRILGTFPGPVTMSPDGSRAAWFRTNRAGGTDELWISDVRTGKEHRAAAFTYPERFHWTCPPAWSRDGEALAFAAEQTDKKGFLVRLYAINLQSGKTQPIVSPRWQWVQNLGWSGREPTALGVVGQEQDSSFRQLWYLAYPNGPYRRIANDLDDYRGVTITDSDTDMVSIQRQTLTSLYLLHPKPAGAMTQITPGGGRYFDISWMGAHQILYASDASGSADLWVMNDDGTGERQLTFGTGRSYAPVASPDGKVIAFHSNRTGSWHIWRVDADGSNAQELSTSLHDGNWPQFTSDGKAVVFHETDLKGLFMLWQVPIQGGPAKQLTKSLTMHPAVSRATGKIAAWYSETTEDPHWKLAVFDAKGGDPLQVFDPLPAAQPDTLLRWTPKGDAITFLGFQNGVSNIWLQPLDGRPPHPVTSFSSEAIYSFDWSPDNRLVFSRGMTTSDVVLIRDQDAVKRR